MHSFHIQNYGRKGFRQRLASDDESQICNGSSLNIDPARGSRLP
jgi:hypothetical protein